MANILVTGAAGFIGSHTVDLLLTEGHSVVGVDNFHSGSIRNIDAAMANKSFSFVTKDVSIAGAFDGILSEHQFDSVIHLAGLVSVQKSISDSELNYRSNVFATHLLAEAVGRHKVPRVIFASSAAVYGQLDRLPLNEALPCRPVSPYGAAKLASESLLFGYAAANGFTVRCLRYFNVYGARQHPSSPYSGVISIFLRKYMEAQPPTIYGDGSQTRDFIAVSDVARANVISATRPALSTGVSNICTGIQTSLNEVVAIMAERFPRAPAPRYAAPRPGDILNSQGDPSLAREELEFTASMDVNNGLGVLCNELMDR